MTVNERKAPPKKKKMNERMEENIKKYKENRYKDNIKQNYMKRQFLFTLS